jgi:ATP-dependent DNA helicase RecQ
MEGYATDLRCRQEMLCSHFTGLYDPFTCELCDVCVDPVAVEEEANSHRPEPVIIDALPEDAKQIILDAVGHLRKPVGKTNLAKALRGSKAKTLSRGGLLQLPEYGSLSHFSEASICQAVAELLDDGRLERKGKKYPTVWLPGRPVRSPRGTSDPAPAKKKRTSKRRYSDIMRELHNYRRRQARALKWKDYMVFQKRVIVAIDAERPRTRTELLRIPGLGPAKIERFGDEILDIVRRYRD